MTKTESLSQTCNICSAKINCNYKNMYDDCYGYPKMYSLLKCESCGHTTTSPELTSKKLATIIHLLAISMFMPENQVHHFGDIAYQHQDFINNYTIEPDKFTNLKLKIITPIWKLSSALKRKSKKLYIKFIKLLK